MNDSSNRAQQLRRLLENDSVTVFAGAHDALSCRIAEQAGFEALWASGLGIAASFGVRDNNEVSSTQVLDVVELMADAASIPILVDGDNGHGDFNSVRRFTRKVEQRGGAGVCIEDTCYPKTNSFLTSTHRTLVSINDFCGKISAATDSKYCADFVVVARIESLVAGLGLEDALRRADAYCAAGADALLIHSTHPSPAQVIEFRSRWAGPVPVIAVPTAYHDTPLDLFREHHFAGVVWANQLLRVAIRAMQHASKLMRHSQLPTLPHEQLVALEEVFRLQNMEEFLNARKRYAPLFIA
jgi:phosphoenolpyruvate phosphomutase